MFAALLNDARTPPAALLVEPEASSFISSSTTSAIPASARWNAMLVPITPPPTTTIDARLGTMEVTGASLRPGRSTINPPTQKM
jgi:hypothetical protein